MPRDSDVYYGEGTFVARERCSTASRPLILLSPYKFRATKSLYSFRAHEILRYRAGNTRAVWPDRVTIRAPGHSFKTSSLHKSKLAKCDRAPTLPPPTSFSPLATSNLVDSLESYRRIDRIKRGPSESRVLPILSFSRSNVSHFFRFEVIVPS